MASGIEQNGFELVRLKRMLLLVLRKVARSETEASMSDSKESAMIGNNSGIPPTKSRSNNINSTVNGSRRPSTTGLGPKRSPKSPLIISRGCDGLRHCAQRIVMRSGFFQSVLQKRDQRCTQMRVSIFKRDALIRAALIRILRRGITLCEMDRPIQPGKGVHF